MDRDNHLMDCDA